MSPDDFTEPKVTTQFPMEWNALTSISQLDDIIAESAEMPVLIFKHSTRCGISRMALRGFELDFKPDDGMKPYYLDLLHFREVSDAIASRFGVVHQSPQILLVKDGQSIYDTSHGDIDAAKLSAKIR